MKLRLPLLILITCGVLLWESGNTDGSRAELLSFSGAIPVVTADFGDLDARDANNQPIQTSETTETLQIIFQTGLYALLMQPNLSSVARMLSILSDKLNLAACALARRLPAAAQAVYAAVVNQLRKFFASPLLPCAGLMSFFVVCAGILLPLLTIRCPSRICPVDVLRC